MTDEKPTTFTCQECGQEKPRKSMRGVPPKRCDDCKDKLAKAKTTERLNALRVNSGRPSIEQELEAEAEAVEVEEDEAAVENEVAVGDAPDEEVDFEPTEVERLVPTPERSWLDDDDAQELLRQKRQREIDTGVPYNPEAHGSVEDYLAAGLGSEPQGVAVEEPLVVDDLTAEDFDTATGRVNELRDRHRQTDISSPAAVCIADCGMPNPPHVGLFCGNHWQQVGLEDRNVLLGTQVNSEPFVATAERVVRKLRW
jgi:hypothetical protein